MMMISQNRRVCAGADFLLCLFSLPQTARYGVGREIVVKVPEGAQGEAVIELSARRPPKRSRPPRCSPARSTSPRFSEPLEHKDASLLTPSSVWRGEDRARACPSAHMTNPLKYAGMQPATQARLSGDDRYLLGLRIYVDKDVELRHRRGSILVPDASGHGAQHGLELGSLPGAALHRRRLSPHRRQAAQRQPLCHSGSVIPPHPGAAGGYAYRSGRARFPMTFGVLSMARSGDPNSNGSQQVFVCLSREGTKCLPDGATPRLRPAIRRRRDPGHRPPPQTGAGDRPIDPMPRIKSARLVDAAPYGTGPKLSRAPTTTSRRLGEQSARPLSRFQNRRTKPPLMRKTDVHVGPSSVPPGILQLSFQRPWYRRALSKADWAWASSRRRRSRAHGHPALPMPLGPRCRSTRTRKS